jgi:hypothetical protein
LLEDRVIKRKRRPWHDRGWGLPYMVNGKQYIAFTIGTPTQAAEVVSLALGE